MKLLSMEDISEIVEKTLRNLQNQLEYLDNLR